MDTDRISALVLALQDRFELLPPATAYDVIDQWERPRSHTAFYRLQAHPSGDHLVVKVDTAGPSDSMKHLYDAMVELHEVITSAGIATAATIRPLAWLDDPPMIVMPFVEGLDLVSFLREAELPSMRATLTGWFSTAGAMLASYYNGGRATEDELLAIRKDVLRLAKRTKLPGNLIDRLLDDVGWREKCSRLYGDFGPGNLFTTPDGNLFLLDPPTNPATGLIHKDLGNFLFELRRQLAGRGYTRTPPLDVGFTELRSAFLKGYAGRSTPLDQCDDALISLYEMRRSIGMARKRFPSRMSDAVWFAGSALARRREMIRRGSVCHNETG